MGNGVTITANFADGSTLDAFSKLLGERMRYLRETARGSVAATAIGALKSIRAITKVAKPSGLAVDVQKDATLYCSCTRTGGRRKLCARFVGSNQRYAGGETIVPVADGAKLSTMGVYRFRDNYAKKPRTYLLFAQTTGQAKKKARQMAASRALRYAGLAKRAVGFLMMKTSTKQTVTDVVSPRVSALARETTDRREVVATSKDGSGGKYGLMLADNLRYATLAVKGGKPAVDTALKRAMNKIVSQINHKVGGGFLERRKLPTPFPELVGKR